MKFKYKKALITGGLGFIGSHLSDTLLQNNIEVSIIDNKSTNVVDEKHFSSRKCRIVTQSISDVNLDRFKDVEIVIHLASILGPIGVLKHAGDISFATLGDTIKMRDFCIKKRIPLIDISTSEIYGHDGVLEENSQKIFPGEYKIRTEYGGGKMVAEMAVCNKAIVDQNLKYHIIRPFNVAGPRQKPDGGFVLPRFVIAALTNQPITIYGNGNQQRAFTHVADICQAIIAITNSDLQNETWNIGNPNNQMTIKKMAKKVVAITKLKYPHLDPKIVFIDPTTIHGKNFTEVVDKIPYINKIQTLLGWKPAIDADTIFDETIDFYQNKIINGYYFKVI